MAGFSQRCRAKRNLNWTAVVCILICSCFTCLNVCLCVRARVCLGSGHADGVKLQQTVFSI